LELVMTRFLTAWMNYSSEPVRLNELKLEVRK
jgi:hypothetical protein